MPPAIAPPPTAPAPVPATTVTTTTPSLPSAKEVVQDVGKFIDKQLEGVKVVATLVGVAVEVAIEKMTNITNNAESGKTENNKEKSNKKGENDTKQKERTANDELKKNKHGDKIPDDDAKGKSHTQLGTKDGRKGKYKQAREFNEKDEPVKDIDFTDHGRKDHPNPHQHTYRKSKTGGTWQRGSAEPLD